MVININQIQQLESKLAEINQKLISAKTHSDKNIAQLASEAKLVAKKIALGKSIIKTEQELAQAQKLTTDPELRTIAMQEVQDLKAKLAKLKQQFKSCLAFDPNDSKNAIIEIRAGTGGNEASLFAAELARMYIKYLERQGFKVNLLSASLSEVGGYKEVILEVKGKNAYAKLKYESGTHRVQRVPETESSGRIHTSAVTVAILPEAQESDLKINPDDLRIDVFRSSGHGGQSVNTTDSAVRITHLPTGTVVTCQDEKSQLKNKTKAMNILRSRLLARKLEEEQTKLKLERRAQIGSGDRSEKIRTYNFPQDRVTDHRINLTMHNLSNFLNGEIDQMVQALHQSNQSL